MSLHAHEAAMDSIHGFAFDQDIHGDHRVKGLGGHRRDHCGCRVGRGGNRERVLWYVRGGRTEGESAEKVSCYRLLGLNNLLSPYPKKKFRRVLTYAVM